MNVTLCSSNELLMQFRFPWPCLSPMLPLLRPLPAPLGHPVQAVSRSPHYLLRYELTISPIPPPGHIFVPAVHDTCPLHAVGPRPGISLMLWTTQLCFGLSDRWLLWETIFYFLSSRSQALNRPLPFNSKPRQTTLPLGWGARTVESPWSCKSVWGDAN